MYMKTLDDSIRTLTETQDSDLLAYIGPIERYGYEALCDLLEKKATLRNSVKLFLCTFGGDANAGYRIARALSHNYKKDISVLVPHYCKSAGTLVCIGAKELVIFDEGELGPLDVQVSKPDEIFASGSGLDIIRGLQHLEQSVLNTFKEHLIEINAGSGLSTKTAAELASKLTIGTYEPIFAQIDPLRLGEMEAALSIANAYGTRLNERFKNLMQGALQKLVSSYPSHGFVIDRKEARALFTSVRAPIEEEVVAASPIKSFWRRGRSDMKIPHVLDLEILVKSKNSQGENNVIAASSIARKPSSTGKSANKQS
jgi:hypothetical protein